MRAGLGDRSLDEGGVAELRSIIRDTGADAAVELEIEQRLGEALAALADLTIAVEARAALMALAGATAHRVR